MVYVFYQAFSSVNVMDIFNSIPQRRQVIYNDDDHGFHGHHHYKSPVFNKWTTIFTEIIEYALHSHQNYFHYSFQNCILCTTRIWKKQKLFVHIFVLQKMNFKSKYHEAEIMLMWHRYIKYTCNLHHQCVHQICWT